MKHRRPGIFPLSSPSNSSGLVKIILSNPSAYVEICNLGASIHGVYLPGENGGFNNVVLNYHEPSDYLSDSYYLGSTIGRVAGRVRSGSLPINGQTFQLSKNEGEHHLHGGNNGFDKKVFEVLYQENVAGKSSARLRAYSEDGEEGYPGRVSLEVTYTLYDSNTLRIDYKADTSHDTHLNVTNHTYFNLSGRAGSALDQELQISSDGILETDNAFLPSGRIIPVLNTPYDFNGAAVIRDRKLLIGGKMFNECFILRKTHDANAVLLDPLSKRRMELRTSYPSLLFYSGDYLGDPFSPCEGICMEAQYLPDAPNIDNSSTLLEPGKHYHEFIELKFIW